MCARRFRIKPVYLSLLPLWTLLFFQPAKQTAADARLDQALAGVAGAAAQFLKSAPRYGAQETLKQKAIVTPRHASPADQTPDLTKDRQILSVYALCGQASRSGVIGAQSLREVRVIYEIDGRSILPRAKAWSELQDAALVDLGRRPELGAEFERESLGDTAVDFGQILLLFQKASLPKYTFAVMKSERIGADPAVAISFEQQSGLASLHLNEAGKRSQTRLEGQIWVRATDYLPLRIVLRAEREHKKVHIRDEAQVDYEPHQGTTLLPASVSHRRYLDDHLRAESIYQYGEWLNLNSVVR